MGQLKEHGSLGDKDDRDKLIEMGADPASFNDETKYYITPVGGKLGSMNSHGLPDDTPLDFHEKVPGSNIVAITIEQSEKPSTGFGVLMMARRGSLGPSSGNQKDDDTMVVVTAHPGMPSVPNPERAKMSREEKDAYDAAEHEMFKKMKAEGRMTVGDIRRLKGREFNLNVIVPS